MDNREIVGYCLRLLRENLALNQATVARKVKRSASVVYRHETGKKLPGLDELSAYLRLYGCTVGEFDTLVEALARFRGRAANGPIWRQAEENGAGAPGPRRAEHERLAEELGAAAGRFALEFLQMAEKARRL
jgi:transcriptional regulator with XRE-family HTH domain